MTFKTIAMIAALAFLMQGPAMAFTFKKKEKPAEEAVKTEEQAPVATEEQAPEAAVETAPEEKSEAATVSSDYRSPRVRALDADKNDKITKEEFLKEFVTQFENMDADKSGTLSPDEIDFPPGTPDAMKADLRKRMQEDEIRRAEDEKRMAEERKRMEEEMAKRRLEDEKRRAEEEAKRQTEAEAAPASAPAPATEAAPAYKTPKKAK